MIEFRDFAPRELSSACVFADARYETFQDAVAAANAWLSDSSTEVVQLETVVLPNVWAPAEDGTADGAVATSGPSDSWHQFLRVWYKEA